MQVRVLFWAHLKTLAFNAGVFLYPTYLCPMAKKSPTPQTPVLKIPAWMRAFAALTQAISTKLAARLAWSWFLTPYPFPIPKREIPWEEKFGTPTLTEHPTGQTYPIYTLGSGTKSIVLVHGWAGRFTQFHALLAHLEATIPDLYTQYTLIGFNAPAHRGASGKRTMMPHFAQCLEQIATTHGPIHTVIAHSLGCNATLFAAQEYNVPIEKQILYAPPGLISAMAHLFCDIMGFNSKVKQGLVNYVKTIHGDNFDDYSAPALAKTNTVPTLVFHDLNDTDTPIELGRMVGHHIQNGTYIETEGLGHRRILRDPEVLKASTDFLLAL